MLHERALERLREGDLQEEKKEKKKNPIAYRSEERFPRDKARELKILIGTSSQGDVEAWPTDLYITPRSPPVPVSHSPALPHRCSSFTPTVDKRYECVILPIYGVMTPFHISYIKNASQTEEGEFSYLRLNFNTPGVTTIKNDSDVSPPCGGAEREKRPHACF